MRGTLVLALSHRWLLASTQGKRERGGGGGGEIGDPKREAFSALGILPSHTYHHAHIVAAEGLAKPEVLVAVAVQIRWGKVAAVLQTG